MESIYLDRDTSEVGRYSIPQCLIFFPQLKGFSFDKIIAKLFSHYPVSC